MATTKKMSQVKKQVVPQAAKPRFVELVRVSSKGQSDRDTPQMQRSALDKLAKIRGGVLVERIEHVGGVSGALGFADRPDLQRLAQLAKARRFDELRCYHLDRLTRNSDPRERFAIYGMVLDAGAIIVDAEGRVTNPADDSGLGEVDYFLRGFFASQERKHILRKTMDGKRGVASEGGWTGEHLPYAIEWDKTAKRFHIDAAKAAVVRRVYEEAASGRSAQQIAQGLNADDIASPRGKPWIACSVLNVLHNDKYATGTLAVTIGGGEPIPYEQTHEPIIPRELWARVQAQLAARHTRPSGPWTTLEALLRGLAYCGRCGRPIHVSSGGAGHYLRYRCSSAHSSSSVPSCGAKWHGVKSTDERVWDQLSWTLTDKTLLAKATALTPSSNGTFEAEAQAATCKAELKDLAHREKKLVNDYLDKHLGDAAYNAARSKIETRRSVLEGSLKVAEDALAQTAVAASATAAIFDLRDEQDRVLALIGGDETPQAAQMRRALLQTYSFEQKRQLVEKVVPRGVDGCGFYLADDGSVEIKGGLEVPGCGPRNLHNSPP